MGQFDNFKSIAMLFTGAFLVSFGVIAFLNIEIQSRSTHGAKIKNENLFEVLGRKISLMISTLKERNSYRRALIYNLFVPENATRAPSRKLQYFTEETNNVDSVAKHYYNQTHRHLRHRKKMKRLPGLLRDKNNSTARELNLDLERKDKTNSDGFNYANNPNANNRTYNTTATQQDVKVHENCYTTNDVLEIIAITCLVNFIFWFMIIFCVNFFTRNQKMWKFDSFESLTSVGSGSDCEINQSYSNKERDFHAMHQHNHLLRDYVNSLPMDNEGENSESERRDPICWSYLGQKHRRNGPEEKLKAEKWIHQGFIHLSNIFFDTASLDNLKSVKKKNFVSRNKNNKIVNSFSMEDLIF